MAVAVAHETHTNLDAGLANVVATVPAWWARRAKDVGLPPTWRNWRLALAEPPFELDGSPIDDLSDAPARTFGEAYVATLDGSTRLREGRHYTPSVLAEALWDDIRELGFTTGAVLDPACGAGSLLLPALRDALTSSDDPAAGISTVATSIRGVDLDPVGVWIGNALLAAELLPLWARLPESERAPLPRLLQVGNGLAPQPEQAQLVVMNPPYGRVRLEHEERTRWQETLFGHANRYALFLHAAAEGVAPGGLVAAVVPTSFLGGAYFQRLRAYFAERAPLVRLTFIDARSGVFGGGVLQETCLAIFRKEAPAGTVRCSRMTLNGFPQRTALPTAPPVSQSALPWLLPRDAQDGPLVIGAARMRERLSDYGWKASTGPLVWNRHKSQISGSPAPDSVPIVWGADIDGGAVRCNPTRDRQRWLSLRDRDEFMRLAEPAVLVQRTTAPEQPRRLITGLLDARALQQWGGCVVVENHVNVLRCSEPRSPLTAELLALLLQTLTLDRLYRCLTGTVAVSAYELDALPLPPAHVLDAWTSLSFDQLAQVVERYYDSDDS